MVHDRPTGYSLMVDLPDVDAARDAVTVTFAHFGSPVTILHAAREGDRIEVVVDRNPEPRYSRYDWLDVNALTAKVAEVGGVALDR